MDPFKKKIPRESLSSDILALLVSFHHRTHILIHAEQGPCAWWRCALSGSSRRDRGEEHRQGSGAWRRQKIKGRERCSGCGERVSLAQFVPLPGPLIHSRPSSWPKSCFWFLKVFDQHCFFHSRYFIHTNPPTTLWSLSPFTGKATEAQGDLVLTQGHISGMWVHQA